ncbi:M16 family metallopeptidase [Roseivirga echinicomitans]
MKKLFIMALALISVSTFAQVDRSVRPEPAAAREIKIGDYESFTLKNGLKVILVENDKLPTVAWTLSLNTGPISEGDKSGLAGMFGQIMRAGTTSKSKEVLDEEIDFMGASVNASATSMSAFSLSKYAEDVLKIMADVLYNPAFPEAELEKVKKQTITGLASAKDDPNSISGVISSIVNYGKDHTYGEMTTEETVANISIEDVKNHYKKYFKPNIAYLVVVGDITKKDAQKLVKKYFSDWEKGDYSPETFVQPATVEKTNVNIADKSSAVQSVINITYPIDNQPGSADVTKLSVLNQILGGSGSARLFTNLREDKGYTYGAYSSIGASRYSATFSANASVRNEVTDSAMVEFFSEMNRIRTELVSQEELDLAKNSLRGSFARSLESRSTVAQFALNTELNSLPEDYYATYLKRLDAITAEDVLAVAKKYIHPDKANIIVVGKADEIAPKLERFGEITYYDVDGNVVDPEAMKAAVGAVDAKSIVDKYLEAIGGEAVLEAVNDVKMVVSTNIQGQVLTITSLKKGNTMSKELTAIGGMLLQESIVKDGEVKVTLQGQVQEIAAGPQLDGLKEGAVMFPELFYTKAGHTLQMTGLQTVNGKSAYVMNVKSPSGATTLKYFDKETGLILKEESMAGAQEVLEYQEVAGIQFPKKIKLAIPGLGAIEADVTVEVNTGIQDTEFKIK